MATSIKLSILALALCLSMFPAMYAVLRLPDGFFFDDPINNEFARAAVAILPLVAGVIVEVVAVKKLGAERAAEKAQQEKPWREWKFTSRRSSSFEDTSPEHTHQTIRVSFGGGMDI